MPSATPPCRIPMTPTVVIPSQSFLRTSTSATPSHKPPTFLINFAYCVCMFVPAGFLRSCKLAYLFPCFLFLALWSSPFDLFFCDVVALQHSAGCGTSAISPAHLEVLPSGRTLGHLVHSV